MSEKNEYNLCVFEDEIKCEECQLHDKIDCHFSLPKLLRFVGIFFATLIIGGLGMLLNGFLVEFIVFLLIAGIFSIVFFEMWEIKILCSHCPFYAENESHLKCYGNYGSLKIWKYNPAPMSKSEKIQLIIGFIILFIIINIPTIVFLLNGLWFWVISMIIGFSLFLINIKLKHCPRCNNFSCPFNTVPKEQVDIFLKKNPVMREAWENSGWRLDET